MSTSEIETELTDLVLDTWSTPNQERIRNFLTKTALKRLDELDDVAF